MIRHHEQIFRGLVRKFSYSMSLFQQKTNINDGAMSALPCWLTNNYRKLKNWASAIKYSLNITLIDNDSFHKRKTNLKILILLLFNPFNWRRVFLWRTPIHKRLGKETELVLLESYIRPGPACIYHWIHERIKPFRDFLFSLSTIFIRKKLMINIAGSLIILCKLISSLVWILS